MELEVGIGRQLRATEITIFELVTSAVIFQLCRILTNFPTDFTLISAAHQRARQPRHGLAAELGDVLLGGVHVGELHLGHLLRGQTVAGHGAVVVPRHGPAPVLVEL